MIRLRPFSETDLPFLLRLYASTREQELAPLPWTAEQKAVFLEQQFWAQHRHWQTHYGDTAWDVVEEDGQPIGRLYVGRWPGEIRIVDVALLPEHRGRGIGTRLLETVLAEADASGQRVTIHVERFNPARGLYARLGFRPAGEEGVYLFLERPPRARPFH